MEVWNLDFVHQVPGNPTSEAAFGLPPCHKQVFSYIMYAFAIVVTLPTLRSTMKEKTSLLLGHKLFGAQFSLNNNQYKATQEERPVHLIFSLHATIILQWNMTCKYTLRCQQMFQLCGLGGISEILLGRFQ